MDNVERYKVLHERKTEVLNRIAEINGQRMVYLKKMQDLGFSSKEELEQCIKSKKVELVWKETDLKHKLNTFEKLLNEVESYLEDTK